MVINKEVVSIDIAEILDTIRQMAAEKVEGSGSNVVGGTASGRAPKVSPASRPVGVSDPASEDDVPRVIRPMTDIRMERFSKLAVLAWPGIEQRTRAPSRCSKPTDTRGNGFGPLVSGGSLVGRSQIRFESGAGGLQDRVGVEGAEKSDKPEVLEGVSGLPDISRPPLELRGEHRQPAVDGSVEDTSAMLLRPLIMNWVNSNMPQIVENALGIEGNVRET